MALSPSPERIALFILTGLRLLNLVSAACAPQTDDSKYGKTKLPSAEIAWYCLENDAAFPGGQRARISPCQGYQLDDTCQNQGSPLPECASPAPTPANTTTLPDVRLPTEYVEYHVCNGGMKWSSGAAGHFTQCINGSWTIINDSCIEDDCPEVPRDCSTVYELGYNVSGLYKVIPSGNQNDFSKEVWCDFLSDPNENGWTTVLKYGPGLDPNEDKRGGFGDPGPFSERENYYIGALELAELSSTSSMGSARVERPLVFRFRGVVNSTEEFQATYDDVVMRPEPKFKLLRVGRYHGTPGNAFNSSYDNIQNNTFWWTADSNLAGLRIKLGEVLWETLPGSNKQLEFIYVSVRPKAFDAEYSCPPAIGYDPSWKEFMPIDFPPQRTEGTVIRYQCVDRQDLLDYSHVPINNITCEKNGADFAWDNLPEFPCGDLCPDDYIALNHRRVCLRFSDSAATFGITSASLQCSSDNATLARIVDRRDLDSAISGNQYYTAHVGMNNGSFLFISQPPSANNISCVDGTCTTPINEEACLIVSKDSTSYGQSRHSCNDDQTFYICQLPAQCPSDFYLYKGLCYKIIEKSSGSFDYVEALTTCATRASALAYPESLDVLEFIKKLVWLKKLNVNSLKDLNPTADLDSDKQVLIGLNDLFGDWSSGYDYWPDEEIISMAGNFTESNYNYRYLNVSRKWNTASNLAAVSYTLEGFQFMTYAACQLHGPIGCWEDPYPVLANMHREWDGSRAVGTKIIYRCYPGYFVHNNSITEQTVECRGQLGGWQAIDEELVNCTLMEACSIDSVPCSGDYNIDIIAEQDALMLNSTMTYICPPNTAMDNGTQEWNTTCSVNPLGTYPSYTFRPDPMPNCSVCTQNVSLDSSTTDWSFANIYKIGDFVTVTCIQDYIISWPGFVSSTNLTCGYLGWEPLIGSFSCKRECSTLPPSPASNSKMRLINGTRHFGGSKWLYECDSGHYIPALSPEIKDKTYATCNSTGVWDLDLESDSDLVCVEMCIRNPPTPHQGNSNWDGITRTIGTQVNLTCPEGLAFPDLGKSIELTCVTGGNWTQSNNPAINPACKWITYQSPPTPPGSVLNGSALHYFEGTVVNFTCPEGFQSSSGLTLTTLTFTGPNWTFTDPSFACLKACGDPPTAVEPVTLTFSGSGVDGDMATYKCLGGFEGSNSVDFITKCGEGVWSMTSIPKCQQCNSTLPAAPEGVSVVPYDGVPAYGALATYDCDGQFSDGTSSLNVTCVDGEWSPLDILDCGNPCLSAPTVAPAGVTFRRHNASIFEAVVTYACAAGAFSGGTSAQFNVTCKDGVWSPLVVPNCQAVSDTTPGPPTEPPVILPTLPPYDPSYPATSDYYWGTIQNNMTDANEKEDNYATTDGPFGFGYAVSLSSNNEQCMIHESYQVGEENCTRNPKQCADGFSFSVWEKALISEDHFGENASFSESDHKYILSTGGDDAGHPGVALYHKGYWLGAVVSTGDKFWKVEVAGIAPNDTWSNIAVRWEPPTESGEKGLELFVDLKKVGQRIYGTTASPLAPLDPALVMIGCHKTSTDTAYRGYNDAEYDEVAMWKRRLADNETNFFFGGFEANFSDVSADDFNQMINNVDLSDPDQRASAVEILKKITFEEPTPSVAPEPTSSSSTSSSSSTAVHSTASSPTASSATVAPPSDEQMARHTSLVELIEKFTSNTSIPKRINTKTHEGMMDILDSVSNLFLPSSFEKWRELQKEKPGSSKVTADLGNWLMGVSKAIVFNNGSEPYKTTKSTETILTETHKIRAGELKSLKNFYEFPEYKLLPDIRKRWNLPYDRSAVPTNLFEDSRCDSRALNIISTLYDTYDDVAPTRVNRNTMDKYLEYELDSRVMSVRAETDPVLNKYRMIDSKAPPCIPKLGKQNPIRLKFEHKVKQYTMRNLKFHSNETVIEINQRICGWFNPAIGEYGAWDRTGCKMLMTTAEYTKCACEHFGTYAIIAEQVEPREVPDEQLWLTITKYIGYILSFIALIIYIVTILVSGDLKDMFHLIGLNLAVAVFFGSIFMLVSDMDTIRDDRHICAAMGTLIQVFYLGAGAWIFVLGHASFKAITAGVISGRLRAYFFLAWSVPLMSMGLTYLLFFHDLGLDPRCFMSWVNEPKYCFFGPQIFFCAVAFIFGCIVICNMSTPALRKDNLIDDYGSFCYGGAFVMIFFAITWTFGLLAYVRFHFREVDFYPIFQVFNSWMGLIILLFIGFGSRRFRMTLAGQAKARREALFGNAFGTPAVPIEDRQHLGSPVDQRSKSATPSVSGRSSPARASSAGQEFPNRPSSMGVVAGRPGSRPNSGF